ncbi:MAG: GDSL family lipase [Saprospiraceae bacterium]|jgi:DNA sulfur modification protein DndE|nr:GDSL family lipase [Saprospiraceae bacterium]
MKFAFLISMLVFMFPNQKQRVFLIGDSTMATKKESDAPETGWGQVLHLFFTKEIEFYNHAVNGRSTKSFRDLGHWKAVLENLKKDDYVIIQFGHNDSKMDDTLRYAEANTDYKANLIRYIEEIRKKEAIPILCTPVNRRKFDSDGKFVDQHGDYPKVVREVAKSLFVDLIDLHSESQMILETLGEEPSKNMFMHYQGGIFSKFPNGITDNTHFSPFGAKMIAAAFCKLLVDKGHPLRQYLIKSAFPNKYQYEVPLVYEPYFRKDTFDITRYGAKSDASFINTSAITNAIDIANAAGGGTVFIPSGLWITGPIILKSNVNLHLDQGALLQFIDDRSHYPIVETTWEGQKAFRCQAPIWSVGQSNIAITGKGIIDGSGQLWKSVKKSKLTDSQWDQLVKSGGVVEDKTWYPSEQSRVGNATEWAKKLTPGKTMADYEMVKDFLRPNMLSLLECNNVLIEGVTFQNSPAWTLHPLLCNHTTFRNVHVKNPWFGQNNDAIDLESCRYGIVDGCTFDTGDDAITIKSGRDEEGRKRGIPTENIIITNTTVFHGHGGFVIGSEMSGGVNNIFVNNCTFLGTDIGLRFKTTRGRGGKVSDIFISDINMSEIVGESILFDMYYAAVDPITLIGDKKVVSIIAAKPIDDGTPIFQNFFMDNIQCKGANSALLMNGLPEMNIKNVNLTNSSIKSERGIYINDSDGVLLQNVSIYHKTGSLLNINNSKNVTVDQIKFTNGTTQTIQINGDQIRKINLIRKKGEAWMMDVNMGKEVNKKEVKY